MSGARAFAYGAGLASALWVAAWLSGRPAPPPAQPPTAGASPLAALSFADAVDRAAPSVVSLQIRRPGSGGAQTEAGSGSAVAVGPNGLLLTSLHAVQDATAIEAMPADGRTVSARLLGGDPDTDIAVLEIPGDGPPPIAVGRTRELRVGDLVLAIGNPFGIGQTVSHGVISATGRSRLGISAFENFIQTDAAINPGSSGGPLVSLQGELLGINTAIYSESGGSHGVGFAVPADLALGVLEQIRTHGRVVRGWLGITGEDVTPALADAYGLRQARGVLVSTVGDDSPAQRAGLRTGDVIDSIDGQAAASSFDVLNLIASRPPGSRLQVRGWRGPAPIDLQVVLGERPGALR